MRYSTLWEHCTASLAILLTSASAAPPASHPAAALHMSLACAPGTPHCGGTETPHCSLSLLLQRHQCHLQLQRCTTDDWQSLACAPGTPQPCLTSPAMLASLSPLLQRHQGYTSAAVLRQSPCLCQYQVLQTMAAQHRIAGLCFGYCFCSATRVTSSCSPAPVTP